MREFSLEGFVLHLAAVAVAQKVAEQKALEKIARLIEKEAKAEIGHYQDDVGPFAGWAELADSTKADRVRQGYSENDPLLRDGTMRDSIQHMVRGNTAYVGSDSEIAELQELGTAKMPPRSFLGGAAARKAEQAKQVAGITIFAALTGSQVVNGSMPIGEED